MSPAIRKRLLQLGFLVLIQAVILFLFAGRIHWGAGWAYVILYIAFLGINALVLLPRQESRAMIEERAEVREGAKGWDKALAMVPTLAGPGMLIIAALDQRFHWTGPFRVEIQILAFVILGLSYALFGWAMASNRFFSTVVRIQTERGHRVETGGPYRYVRHPGYVGLLLSYLAIPASLGSAWAYIPTLVLVITLLIRTVLEDRTLLAELVGYQEYTVQVPHRLIPGVW
jgi:protein-S-isoprenylcysteine O-methyltransferase Ste14